MMVVIGIIAITEPLEMVNDVMLFRSAQTEVTLQLPIGQTVVRRASVR
jgi:hypothetical protein